MTNPRIYLIDDDLNIAFVHREIILEAEITHFVRIFVNGMQALECLKVDLRKNQPPNLILLDLQMPQMNGFQFIEEYYKQFPSCEGKIVILSSSKRPDDVMQAKLYGVSNFIEKPLTKDKINQLFEVI